jgi:prepilin peptidase dependent protein B
VTQVNKHSLLRGQRGLSIVEFMVGIAVGLFIVGGATKLFADYIVSNKRLLLETRVNQDLRAAADIVARDVRRAGYWNNSLAGVWGTGSTAITPNPHATGAGAVTSTSTSVNYSYARDTDDALDSNEYAGFRVQAVSGVNTLQMQDGQNNWQAITDPGTVRVTAFSVTAASPALVNDLSKYCGCLAKLTCTLAQIADPAFNAAGVPTLTIPSFQIVLTGQAVNDSAITRTVSETVRVRNPRLTGSCPP